jgi:Tfp pilus assembly protein PilX
MKRAHRKTREQAGFTLLVVMLVIAAMAAAGVAVLGLVDNEIQTVGRSREESEAVGVAEGGVMDAIDDELLGSQLPDFSTPQLTATYRTPGASPWISTAQRRSYSTQLRFLRVVPISESSQNWSRALVYEVDGTGSVVDGDATAQVSAEVYRTISVPPGTLLPRVHAK